MPDSFFIFGWPRPQGARGFVWGEGHSTGASRTKPFPVLEWPSDQRWEQYDPFEEETGLFRIFADTETTPEAMLAFANRYGFLGYENIRAESQGLWRLAIRWLRYLVNLWELARNEDRKALARLIHWDGDSIIFRRVFLPSSETISLLPEDWDADQTVAWSMDTHGQLLPLIRPGEVIVAALLYIEETLNEELKSRVMTGLHWNPKLRRSQLLIRPTSLWGAMCLQFAWAIDGNKKYHQCPVCGRWFELAPGLNRANRLTCSSSCRTRGYRQRQELAVQMHAKGKTPREIAKEIGSDVKTVKGWITKSKER